MKVCEHINALKDQSPKLVQYDQSASVRCPIHGHHCITYFVADGVPAQYVCGRCWDEACERAIESVI